MSIPLSQYRPVTRLKTGSHPVARAKFPVFDIHTHFGPLVIGRDYDSKYDTGKVLEGLRRHGVQRLCNLELVWGSELERLERKLAGRQGTVYTFPSVDLSGFELPGFEDSVQRAMEDYRLAGYRGIKLWKDITLYRKDSRGRHIRLDDERLACIFSAAGENGLTVLIHIADPVAFFTPFDARNEYYECLAQNPEWLFYGEEFFSFEEHMRMQEAVLKRHPGTTFIIAHTGSCSEDLGFVSRLMDSYPNMHVDIAARINELGRQPYTARKFFIDHQDRILFGTDYIAGQDPEELYPYYFRFLETFDEYFDYGPEEEAGSMGRWKIYGIGLPDDVLEKVYHLNAERLLRLSQIP